MIINVLNVGKIISIKIRKGQNAYKIAQMNIYILIYKLKYVIMIVKKILTQEENIIIRIFVIALEINLII